MIDDNATGRALPIATAHNATDRQHPVAAPRAHQEPACRQADELTALYRHAPLGLAVLDRDLRFTRINETLAEINGYSAEKHIGRTVWEIVPSLREAAEPLLRSVLDSGETIAGGEISGETAKYPGVHRHWIEQFYPIKAADGSIVGVGVICEEVSAGKQAAAALAGSEARYQAIVETAVDAIVVIDERGLIQAFNPAAERIFGYASGEAVGRNVALLMDEGHAHAHDSYLAAYRTTGVRKIIGIGREVAGKRRNGSVFPLDLAIAEWRDAAGARFFTGMIRDIAKRKRSEEVLRQSQKMEAVGQLTGGIAHDFNNLLTVILGNLEMLEERLINQHDRLLLREAQGAVHSGAELTGRLLAFARRQPLDPRPVDLHRQVEELAKLLRRTLVETIELRTIVQPDMPLALVDPGQLQNALLNLALNARDAMPGGGTLVLEAGAVAIDGDYARAHANVQPGSFVMLSVTDTGIGMMPEVLEQAFDPFFTTKGLGAGTGLGLAMVYGFALQSGGHAQIYSEPGQGSTVRLYLPQAGQPEKPDRALEASATAFKGRGEVVLVVEDDPRVRRFAAAKLGSLGYRVFEAADGPAAVALVQANAGIDLLFTDVVMPGGMSGRDVAERARELVPDLAVILTSGYAAPELLQRGIAEGARWLRKPYTALELARTVRKTLDGVPQG